MIDLNELISEWFNESIDSDMLDRMENCDIIACAKGFKLSVIASLEVMLDEKIAEVQSAADIRATTMLYAFAGAITSLKTPITFSENHLATDAANIAAGIANAQGLPRGVDFDGYVPFNYETENK